MPDESDLAGLEVQRARLYVGLSQVGDSCRGTLNAVRRKCGKPNCACAQPGHPGHGPQYNLTRWAGGKTVTGAPAARPGAGEGGAGGRRVRAVQGSDRADRGGERGDLRRPAAAADG